MCIRTLTRILLCLLLMPQMLQASPPSPVLPDSLRNAFIQSPLNRLSRADLFHGLKRKLADGKTVRFVHLGDSHIQADMMTRVLRRGLQDRFGNAGRGIVFPYQLAGTNAPQDIQSFSSVTWRSVRLAKPVPPMMSGLSGYAVSSDSLVADLDIGVKAAQVNNATFDRIRVFAGGGEHVSLTMPPYDNQPVMLTQEEVSGSVAVDLAGETDRVLIKSTSEGSAGFSFYGVSLEKKRVPGVIYHAIGVNGADYPDYNDADLFWRQIGFLEPDCYVISLGTNKAQNQKLKPELFAEQVRSMVRRLKKVSPEAVIVLTTPPPSYYRRLQSNPMLEKVAGLIVQVAADEDIVTWDLYHAVNGEAGALQWQRYDLFRPDRIHFNRRGYELQGEMLLHALMRQLSD